jgi:hypothetical protein
MLEHVKLNVHQLNMDHLYLQLLTPCINKKNEKSKKTSNIKLIVPPPTPPFFCHQKKREKKQKEKGIQRSLSPMLLETTKGIKINMNEELEVHWHPYAFHYHKPMLLERSK